MKTTYAAALGLAWQLVAVVLVPIVIGLKADAHFHSSPVGTLIGLTIGMVAMVIVVWQQAKQFSPKDIDAIEDTEEDTK